MESARCSLAESRLRRVRKEAGRLGEAFTVQVRADGGLARVLALVKKERVPEYSGGRLVRCSVCVNTEDKRCPGCFLTGKQPSRPNLISADPSLQLSAAAGEMMYTQNGVTHSSAQASSTPRSAFQGG